ncbi:glucose-1-phosphate adenylyltransferase [Sorangium sp. So ce1099]|uniref:glucose-1-phosphate adenylyltransferase n=1 Tax=Sorangium sp. So ce1099 TaxID=3133331 RepID=UPI003F5D66D1
MKHNDVVVLILGGGVGSRLYPLTKLRSKPAVPTGGKYRLVDIPISNCLNSGFNRIHILTQYNSVSLHNHITQTYRFDVFSAGAVQILAAEQTPNHSDWYQGTADAVRKQLGEVKSPDPRDVMILSGDHLYRMDYEPFLAHHRETRADVTLAVRPVPTAEVSRLGIVATDDSGRVVKFVEKPKDMKLLDNVRQTPDPKNPWLASMGVYIFRAKALYEMLERDNSSDFGTHILPQSLDTHRMVTYTFDGYWEDIGTIRSYYEASLALTDTNPPFSFYDPQRPIYTRPQFFPPAHVTAGSVLDQVLLAEGSRIIESKIQRSVVGQLSSIGPHVTMSNTVMMGADYESLFQSQPPESTKGLPPIGIGRGCKIDGAIIDKNARIGEGVVIRNLPDREDTDAEYYAAREGVVVVPKNAVVPPGTVI